jgi:transposase
MNALQKQNIANMRGKGESYAKIAVALNISENTVKSYCRRNNLGGELGAKKETPAQDSSLCKQCGAKLKQAAGTKTRKFCSAACCSAWWNAHPEEVRQKAVYSYTCAYCGTKFSAYGNSSRKYCSHDCYIKARFAGTRGERS